jgi:hypothetical protein
VQAPRGEVVGGVGQAALDCCNNGSLHAFSREHVLPVDKAIKLTSTLRDSRFPIRHLMVVERRAAIKKHDPR